MKLKKSKIAKVRTAQRAALFRLCCFRILKRFDLELSVFEITIKIINSKYIQMDSIENYKLEKHIKSNVNTKISKKQLNIKMNNEKLLKLEN